MEQFSEDIRRYLEGRAVIARIDTPGYRLAKFVRRNALGVGTAVALVALLSGTAIFLANRERQGKRHFEQATILLERQLLRADLEIGNAERVRKAYDLAQTIWRAHPEQVESRRDLAEAAARMGETTADRNAAATYYGEALAQFDLVQQAGQHDARTELEVESVASKLGAIELEQGNLLAALSHFTRALRIAEGVASAEGASVNVADANAQVGEVLLRNGARAEGVAKLRKAISIYRNLGQQDRADALEAKLRKE